MFTRRVHMNILTTLGAGKYLLSSILCVSGTFSESSEFMSCACLLTFSEMNSSFWSMVRLLYYNLSQFNLNIIEENVDIPRPYLFCVFALSYLFATVAFQNC